MSFICVNNESFHQVNARFNYSFDESSNSIYWHFIMATANKTNIFLYDVCFPDVKSSMNPDDLENKPYTETDNKYRHSIWVNNNTYFFEDFEVQFGNWYADRMELRVKGSFNLVYDDDFPLLDNLMRFDVLCKFEGINTSS